MLSALPPSWSTHQTFHRRTDDGTVPFHRPCKPSDATTFCNTCMEDIWPPPGLCIRVFIKSIGLETAAAMAPDVHPAAMLPAKEGLSLLIPKSPFTGPYRPSLTPALTVPLRLLCLHQTIPAEKTLCAPALLQHCFAASERAVVDQGKITSLSFPVYSSVKWYRTTGWQRHAQCSCLKFTFCAGLHGWNFCQAVRN